jgi:predicted lysophospholipase L1 biosynthesis ABC-type transport system permease subunit
MGSVLASGCGNLLVNVLSALAVYRISSNRIQAAFWLKTAMICVVSSFAVSLLVSGEGFGSLALAGVVYMTFLVVGFLFVKPLTDEDSEWLTRVDDRVRKPLAYFAR